MREARPFRKISGGTDCPCGQIACSQDVGRFGLSEDGTEDERTRTLKGNHHVDNKSLAIAGHESKADAKRGSGQFEFRNSL